jgi:hypothetical protein
MLDLQNSREAQKSSNCGFRKHFGAAGFLGIADFRNTLEWRHHMELRNSEAILSHPRALAPGGSHGAVGAGVGQQIKPRTCKAGAEWVAVGTPCKSKSRKQHAICLKVSFSRPRTQQHDEKDSSSTRVLDPGY